uniref:Uncharacterized protein n=1 Tax=viral metagenome TaxID=1070528 RepID=A0A6M3XFW0_9ZZZZ
MNENIKHWLKIDHITFLLIAPAIIFGHKYIALILWLLALIYDLYELKFRHKKEVDKDGRAAEPGQTEA